ncbi:MAG TPA: tryptophanase [bacterium]|jgi:tryptophanase|nr:tryptophanase [Myxococcales bacterium]OQA62097.1 MAG: Tyrosine phenol-lyase [bacterium ADurb.Bin270]HPW46010.1 tryptophanase [bacterium]HQC51057.1 tryptophanase [bacterium]HQH79977.1 tryptophanase [bacterium]
MVRKVVPYKIKIVEPIALLSREDREAKISEAGLNIFRLRSKHVYIDLLTDSGTGALSQEQLSQMMIGDESYAGSESFFRLEKAIRDIMHLPYVIPVHQGRAAEQVLDFTLVREGQVVPGNTHFDTTKAHIEFRGGRTIDCTIAEGRDSTVMYPFKGNIDMNLLEHAYKKYGREKISYVLITVTCNSGGGQPVSMENIRQVSSFCAEKGLRLFFDAARFAENAYFIQQREPGYADKSIKGIVREMFSYVEGCTMSAKKDGLVPIGGFLALRDEKLYEEMKPTDILFEGFYTYGGMSGMNMDAMAQGLCEVVEESYLAHRIGQTSYLGEELTKRDVPIVRPVGGHAVFIDGRRFFPNVPESEFPAQLLVVELYREGGVRAVEVGSCLAGRDPDSGDNIRPALDLCRLTIPRRVYTEEHFDYVADVVDEVFKKQRSRKRGLGFDVETKGIRHFTSTFKEL